MRVKRSLTRKPKNTNTDDVDSKKARRNANFDRNFNVAEADNNTDYGSGDAVLVDRETENSENDASEANPSQESTADDLSNDDDNEEIEEAEDEYLADQYFDVDMQPSTVDDKQPGFDDDYRAPYENPTEFTIRKSGRIAARKRQLLEVQRNSQMAMSEEDLTLMSRKRRFDNESDESDEPSTSKAKSKKTREKKKRKIILSDDNDSDENKKQGTSKPAAKSKIKRKRKNSIEVKDKKRKQPHHNFPLGKSVKQHTWTEGAKIDYNDDFEPEREPGPSPETLGKTPIELFDIIWKDLKLLVLQKSNKKATLLYSHCVTHKWRVITEPEFDLFLALLLSMGLNPKRRIRDYWRKNTMYGSQWYKSKMSCERFERILTSVTCVENAIELQPNGTGNVDSPNYSVSWKIDPMLNELMRKFQQLYYPYDKLCVDEIMVKFTGKFTWKQNIPRKPIKEGIKLFGLNCGRSNYLLNFIPYMAQTFIRDKESPIFANVWALIYGENIRGLYDLTGRGFRLGGDSYYSMVGMIDALRKVRVYYVGTIPTTRGIPKEYFEDFKLDENGIKVKMDRGDFRYYTNQDKTIQLIVWKDNKIVRLLSSLPEFSTETISSERKCVKVKNGKKINSSMMVEMPAVVEEFNSMKAGTDRFNAHVATAHRNFKSRDWTRPMILFGFESSLVNIMIILNENFIKENDAECGPWTNRKLRENIINSLITRAQEGGVSSLQPENEQIVNEDLIEPNLWMANQYDPNRTEPPKLNRLLPDFNMKPLRLNRKILHVPGKGSKKNLCIVHKQYVRSSTICMQCKVALCPEICWKRWHSNYDYLYDDPLRPRVRVIRNHSCH